jgi:hypothetical protein
VDADDLRNVLDSVPDVVRTEPVPQQDHVESAAARA